MVWSSLVWWGAVWCGVVGCGVVWCGEVWCGVVWCGVVWCGLVWCGVGVVWCSLVVVLIVVVIDGKNDNCLMTGMYDGSDSFQKHNNNQHKPIRHQLLEVRQSYWLNISPPTQTSMN